MHRLKMALCQACWRVLWRWWPHIYMATPIDNDSPAPVHAGSPRDPDMATINRSVFVVECVIKVGYVVQSTVPTDFASDEVTHD